MTFGTLTLIVLAGLAGPLVAAASPRLVPAIVGELGAGVVIGHSGFGWLDATEPTVAFFAAVGFAMLMFTAGTHVPLRQPGLRRGLQRGLVAAAVAALLAVPCGLAVARLSGSGHAAIYALLLASGSAAIVGPVLRERRLQATSAGIVLLAQVAIADVAAIVTLPLVLQPPRAVHAAAGGLLVASFAFLVWEAARRVQARAWVRGVRRLSKRRGWALDLRLALLVLFGLAWVAQKAGTSVLLAGFGAGLIVAATGGPKRLSRQITGVGQGFFVPLFFVVLGARIDLHALIGDPSLLVLAALLLAVNVLLHVVVARLTGQRPAAGLIGTAQLGVPAAAATLGLSQGVLSSGEAAAILAAALGSLATTAAGAAWLARTRGAAGYRDRSRRMDAAAASAAAPTAADGSSPTPNTAPRMP